jgi:hypothetical protein
MDIGDDQLDTAEATPGQLAREFRPDRLGHGSADVHAQHLGPAVALDADPDDDQDRVDAAAALDLQMEMPAPIALTRASTERVETPWM